MTPSNLMDKQESLDDALLEQFMSRFLGYGNFSAPIWFIGMEEGGGNDFAQVSKRLEVWRSLGTRELEDVRDYHLEIGIDRFFREPIKLQRTWAHLMRVYLSVVGEPHQVQDLKNYQRDFLGRENGDTAILELMPLPSPGTNRWFYDAWSNLSLLKNRKSYLLEIMPRRISSLKKKIDDFRPKVVVFYGTSYRNYFEQIIGSETKTDDGYGCYVYENATSIFLVIKHPAARGVTKDYFISIGKHLKSQLI
jgi:hypothetical protein